MVAMCRRHGVEEVALDGAHSLGLLPRSSVRVEDIGADFYFTNVHKWAFASGPASALHVAERHAGGKGRLPWRGTAAHRPTWTV